MLNVLSIDWDYFIDASGLYRDRHFPDIPNEDYPKSLQDAIWTSRYAEDDTLLKVGINPAVYGLVERLAYIPYMYVCDSHKWAYTFAIQRLRETGNKRFNFLNIDFHSDCRKDSKKLDCGNWYSILMNEYRGKWNWIGWPDSYKVGKPRKLQFSTVLDVNEINSTSWDMLFVCRSDMWSLPHLDNEFTKIFKPLMDSKTGQVQKGIWDSRYDRLHNDIEGLKIALDDWKRGMQKK